MARDLALERGWRKRMREYERSGLTIREFCKREGLVDHQFAWWRSELKRRDAEPETSKNERRLRTSKPARNGKQAKAAAKPQFVPVQIESAPHSPAAVEIVLDEPPRINVRAGFDAELLRAVVNVLENR